MTWTPWFCHYLDANIDYPNFNIYLKFKFYFVILEKANFKYEELSMFDKRKISREITYFEQKLNRIIDMS